MCACGCMCARACACAHVSVTYTHSLIQSHSRLCVRLSIIVDDSLYCKAAPFSVCCVHLAVLGAVGGGLASSAHEWLRQRPGAVIAQRGITVVALGRCVLRPWHLVSLGTLVQRQSAGANGVADGGAERRRRALLRPAADDARSSSPLQKTRQSSNGQIQLDTPTTRTSWAK